VRATEGEVSDKQTAEETAREWAENESHGPCSFVTSQRHFLAGVQWAQEREKVPSHAYTMVQAQAEDEGLWFEAETATEANLQNALRRLHAAVEQDRKEVPL
jgi:hypothetical protein